MTLDVDEVLRSDAERWRATVPAGRDPQAAIRDSIHGGRSIPRGKLLASVASIVVVLVIASALVMRHGVRHERSSVMGPTASGSVHSPRSQLTPAERKLALRVAHEIAASSGGNPAIPHPVPTSWPDYVTRVSVLSTTAENGAQFLDGNTSATGRVLVIRLIGTFIVLTTGPRNTPYLHANQVTVLVPVSSGATTDSTVQTVASPSDLPGSTILFSR